MNVTKWLIFLTSFLFFLEQPKRSGRKQTTSMSSLINKKVRANDVSLPKPHPQDSSPPLSDLEQRIKLISSKLDEGNVKGGIRLAASDDKIAPFLTDNYQKLLSKHPQRANSAALNPQNLDSFFVTEFDLYKAIMSFPNGSAADPDKIVPQILKDLVSKSNGSAGINFLKSLTKLINLFGDCKIPEPLKPVFFGAKLIALIKIDGGLRPIAIGNTLRRIASKCAGSKALSERQNFFGNLRVGCGAKRGAEIAAHSFRNLTERYDKPKCTVLLILDFKKAFNSLNRETMLNHVYSNRPQLYNYTHCAYGKLSYLFYGSSVIMSEDGTQQGDPEAPPLFAETIHTLVKQLESKINIWYLDNGNLADDYKVVLRDLKNILKLEQIYGLSLNTEKCELCFLRPTTSTQYNSILTQFRKICPKIKKKEKKNSSFKDLQSTNFAEKVCSTKKLRRLKKSRMSLTN